jgi:hypothetical protein
VIAAIVISSLLPWHFKQRIGIVGLLHEPLHFAAFGLASSIIAAQFQPGRRFWAWAGTIALGFAVEAIESFLFRSAFEWHDALYDSAGVIAAFMYYRSALSSRTGAK